MAGAPSALGCEACRKQKKKCDQGKPACRRCTRLKIVCVGSGQKRFIFKQERGDSTKSSPSPPPPGQTTAILTRTPSNEFTRRGSAFIDILEISDVRYAISSYGNLLLDIPMRLGRNPGLDAAVHALTINYGSYRTSRSCSPEAISSHVKAVQVLRECFHDPVLALAPETLCGMYLCVIMQGLMDYNGETNTHHAEAMAQIMNAAVYKAWQPGFESDLLMLMCVPLILESFFNPKIELEPWIWNVISKYEPTRTPGPRLAAPFQSLQLSSLVRFSIYLRSTQPDFLDIQDFYHNVQMDLPELRRGLNKVAQSTSHFPPSHPDWPTLVKGLARIQAAYGLLLMIGLMLNYLILKRFPGHQALLEEASNMCQEVIRNAHDAMQHRPLGSSTQPFSLVTVIITTEDLDLQCQARRLVQEYALDLPATNWMELGQHLRSLLR